MRGEICLNHNFLNYRNLRNYKKIFFKIIAVGWNSKAYSTLFFISRFYSALAEFHGGIRFAIPPYKRLILTMLQFRNSYSFKYFKASA